MEHYKEVTSQGEMDELVRFMGDFHDSMTKEIHMINRGGVLADHSMMMSHQFDAQVLIQSPWQPFAVELLFVNVLEISVNDSGDYYSASGSVKQQSAANEMPVFEMKFDSNFVISARRLFYQLHPEYLGMSARLKTEVPSPAAKAARRLDAGWRQCSDCSEAWEDDPDAVYSVCPKCLTLTMLTA